MMNTLVAANANLNPMLYAYYNQNFRDEYKSIYR